MKLRITEKFLWDLCELIIKKDEFMDSLMSNKWYGFKGIEEIIWPDIYQTEDAYWKKLKKERRATRERQKFSKLIRYLKNRGYLNIKDLKNRKAVMITPKGMEKLYRTRLKTGKINKRPDKKWQMVIFDIPENKRRARDLFRKELKYLGYKKLQRSVWVSPYNIFDETRELIKNHNLGRFVRLLVVEEMKV